jgi:hypothetical protein
MYRERVTQAVEMVMARAGRLMQRACGSATADLSTAGSKLKAVGQAGRSETGKDRRRQSPQTAMPDDIQ